MPLVRVLKNLGFEQAGDIVNYTHVDLEEKVAAGELEVLDADPRPEVTSTSVEPTKESTPETTEEESKEESAPVVTEETVELTSEGE